METISISVDKYSNREDIIGDIQLSLSRIMKRQKLSHFKNITIIVNIYVLNQIFRHFDQYLHSTRTLGILDVIIDNKLDDSIYFYMNNEIVGKLLLFNFFDNNLINIYEDCYESIDNIQILEF